MGFWDRLKNVFSANINAFLEAAEDPELALEEIVREMTLELRRTKAFLLEAMMSMKKLEREGERHSRAAIDFREKAKLILRTGDAKREYLAKEALLRQRENEQIAAQIQTSCDQERQRVDILKRNIDRMERKVSEARAKKSALVARKRIAESQAVIARATSSGQQGRAQAEFKRIEEKIDDMSLRSEVEARIARESRESRLEDQIEEIEFGQGIDLELEKLRKELLVEAKDPVKQLPKQEP